MAMEKQGVTKEDFLASEAGAAEDGESKAAGERAVGDVGKGHCGRRVCGCGEDTLSKMAEAAGGGAAG